MKRHAAVDLGTNTARLLVADLERGAFEPVRIERRIIRLGGGFTRERGISPEAWSRGVETLRSFSRILSESGAERVRAVATSAVRDAVNGEEFRREICRETGIDLEIIDGTEEGLLTLRGVAAGVTTKTPLQLVFDVGGGSTEYTVARGFSPVVTESLPIGVVRLTEGCRGNPAVIRERVTTLLRGFRSRLSECFPGGSIPGSTLIGTAGTATTIAAIHLGLDTYDYRLVNGHEVSRGFIGELFERLLPLPPEERLRITGMEKGREDLIVSGLIITMETMDAFGFDSLVVSDFGLLEGVLLSTVDTNVSNDAGG
ncbi:MAG: exopolyphosphatase [Desulfuromonadia bacterium]